MAVADQIEIVASDRMLEVRVSGKLTKEAYEQLVPVVDQQIKEFGKLRILFVMDDFHGWTAGAMWEDTKFDLKHWKDIERLAIVGETQMGRGHGHVLQAVHHRQDQVLRSQPSSRMPVSGSRSERVRRYSVAMSIHTER